MAPSGACGDDSLPHVPPFLSDSPQEPGAGDFTSLYQRHAAHVYAYLFSQVGNRQEAEDLTSAVFLKVLRALPRFEGRGTLESWLFQIARATISDHWREHYKLAALPLPDQWDAPDLGPAPLTSPSARETFVHELLDRLPPNYRAVLTHRFLLRSTVRDTARALGLSESNVKVLQFRALRRAAELGRDAL
ncbi:MAG TPA: sigma-70 family RNA polymerase sigma factor [Chloroflexota bacterium]|nr:sigma-70 family RNA polymerase sigma factor [Chloroflexota bacterium]